MGIPLTEEIHILASKVRNEDYTNQDILDLHDKSYRFLIGTVEQGLNNLVLSRITRYLTEPQKEEFLRQTTESTAVDYLNSLKDVKSQAKRSITQAYTEYRGIERTKKFLQTFIESYKSKQHTPLDIARLANHAYGITTHAANLKEIKTNTQEFPFLYKEMERIRSIRIPGAKHDFYLGNRRYSGIAEGIPSLVGGDNFNLMQISPTKYLFTILDLTGKDSANFVRNNIKGYDIGTEHFLKGSTDSTEKIIRSYHSGLEKLLGAYSEKENPLLGEGILAVYDSKENEAVFSAHAAAQMFVFNRLTRKLRKINIARSAFLGLNEDPEPPVINRIKFNRGDILVASTDGITEQRNQKRKFFNLTGIGQVIKKTLNEDPSSSLENIRKNIFNAVYAHAGRNYLNDDARLVLFEKT